ncbi:hypothetical protein E1218_21815 [Kribbella turkmenica]|uniref:Uncharacterized protein n=1 Tax=Kribbella turkmenica TaxID=2530375 RepID=A0A4R4WTC1_9ACTN|nr:hypothetical protein [Kribbella turkmenica]TDD20860.1 hypothetical protein E1218_21815 [Kribbella turkmenica]
MKVHEALGPADDLVAGGDVVHGVRTEGAGPRRAVGGESRDWRRDTAQVVADLLPNGRRLTMDGHPHDVEPDVLGPIVERFVTMSS